MREPAAGRGRDLLLRGIGLSVAYALAGMAGLVLPRYSGHFALIWIPAGLAVFALFQWGVRFWPAILAGSALVSLRMGTELSSGVVLALFNTIGPVLTVWLLRSWRFDPGFARGRDLFLFLSASLLGMCVMASGGTLGLWRGDGQLRELFETWLTWWLSDCTGVLLVTPFLLSLRRPERAAMRSRLWEFGVWSVLAVVASGIIFLDTLALGRGTLPLAFLVLPLAAWAGMRFGLLGMTFGVLLICGLAVLGLALRVGPFVQPERSLELLNITLFLLSVMLVGWLVMGLQRARDRSEQLLRENQESIELAVRGSSDGYWDWNVVTDEVYHPQRWLAKLGYAPEDWPRFTHGAAWFGLLHPEDRPGVEEALQRHFHQKAPYAVELRMRTKSGAYRWFLSRGEAIRNSLGRVVRMAGSHTDITDRLAEQERLRLLELCLSRSNDVVMICSASSGEVPERIVYVNEAFARETGYSAQEALGRGPRFLEGRATPLDAAQTLETAFRERSAARVELIHYRKGGSAYWVEVDLVPVLDTKGTCTHFVAVQREINERKRAESEREAREEQVRAAQRFETLGTLAGGFAHHFNNLLTGINGYIELARENLPAGHPSRSDLESALSGGQAAANLVHRVLVYARRLPQSKRQRIDLVSLVRETLPLLEISAPGRSRFVAHLPDQPAWVLGDHGRLQQALMNLCLNGAQAGGETGEARVEVTVRLLSEGDTPEGFGTCVEVEDRGCGMDAETVKRIFDPFFTTKPTGQGTGLGLSVVQGIVLNHGGEIRVTSTPGKGSTFRVLFPRPPTVAAESGPGVPA